MKLFLIVHDIRSCHNVGSLLRTADGLGVDHIYLTGYTPYPLQDGDGRLPHIARKLDAQIHKTALGAEHSVAWSHHDDVREVLARLTRDGTRLLVLEQTAHSQSLPAFRPDGDCALLIGREVEGVDPELLQLVDTKLEIPMFGRKESFNVVQATAMALYQCRFFAKD